MVAYLGNTLEFGITYTPQHEREFISTFSTDGMGKPVQLAETNLFSDASWASKVEDEYSISGKVITVFGTVVAWKSKRQPVRAASTCQSEWVAAAEAIKWAESLGFLEFFMAKYDGAEGGLPKSTLCWVDSTSAMEVSKADELKPASRHMALRWHRVRDEASRYCYCSSQSQKADALTKIPDGNAIACLLGRQGMVPIDWL